MLDFLGDVGGLFSILIGIGQILVQIYIKTFGSQFNQFLISQIMKQSPLSYNNGKLFEGVMKKNRRNCCRKKEKMKQEATALNKMAQELDVITFIRKQMMFSVMFDTIFTKSEQFLAKNQRKFVIGHCDDEQVEQQNEFLLDSEAIRSPYFKALLEGARTKRKEHPQEHSIDR